MEKSFSLWRDPVSDDESGNDTDIIEDSEKNICSDVLESSPLSLNLTKRKSDVSNNISIQPSDEEENSSSSEIHSVQSAPSFTNSNIKSQNPISLSSNKEKPSSPENNLSSPEFTPRFTRKKNIHRPIIESDDDSPSRSSPAQCVSSDDETNSNDIGGDKSQSKSKHSLGGKYKMNVQAHSTRIGEDDLSFTSDTSTKSSGIGCIDLTDIHISPTKNNIPKTQTFHTVDLTINQSFQKYESRNLINDDKSDDDGENKVVIVNTDSEEDESIKKKGYKTTKKETNLNGQLSSLKISPTVNLPKSSVLSKNENDYASRIESLKAEEIKLKEGVSEVLKNIEQTKTALMTANVSALPDKGVRLKMYLKKQESQLRDLRYQQNSLSNEILKLQFSSHNKPQPKPQLPKERMFKLPTADTDLNAMGKRALETHRTQQALTLDALRSLHASLKNCPTEEIYTSDPKGLLVELMPHQKHALAWLLWRESEKPFGGILADDMGLGKTLTMISLILKSNEEKNDGDSEEESDDGAEKTASRPKLPQGKTLVVCPASLLGQWEGEVNTKVRRGTLDTLIHHGSNREKQARRLARPDIVITTYNIISRDASKLESPLFQVRWERVILDEAHQIRNHKTQMAQGVFLLKAKKRWALTGTPVHNKELDLYALIKFIRCSPFDDLAVWKRWVDNRDAAGTQRLSTITKSLMLRRTKEGLQEKGELKSLTSKTQHTIFVALDKEELVAYEKLLNFSKTLFSQFLYQKAEKENALMGVPVASKPSNYLKNAENPFQNHPHLARLHDQLKEIPDVKSHDILLLLLRLRQFCCHPALIKTMLNEEDVSSVGIEDDKGLDLDMMDKLTALTLEVENKENRTTGDDGISTMSVKNALFAEDRLSSKMRRVLEVLKDLMSTEDKIVVVSQWVSLLNLMQAVLKANNFKCVMLTGSVPVKDRAEIVDKFNRIGHGPRIMLLSLTAGGVGLNLVGGNHLLLLDLHWNPQLENQACDRIYRVGQKKQVQIYKFISAETIEENILELQQKKLSLAQDVLTGAKHISSKLTLDDLKTLFR